ncbi:hypothetical protein WAK64_08265 [Bacillus spongiae]|uniref:DUF5316 domain-containing protein n=1 Tax=Bacillus spongiae TaxID=2683610 RepID=A0ABU8HCY8_9BACI
MKKKIGIAVFSSIVIGLIVWLASLIFAFSYFEWSFFIGLALTGLLFLFNSSGGTFSKGATLEASEAMWKIQKESGLKTNVGAFFYGSVIYTIISLIIMVVKYTL